MQRESNEVVEEKREAGIRRFREYYQRMLPDAEEIIEKLREPLPTTFRILPGPFQKMLEEEVQKHPAVRKTPWCGSVYEILLSRKELRQKRIRETQNQDAEKIHELIKTYTGTAAITRQEIVSMLPIIALGVQKDSKVLDMCASPGSKSSQVLEILEEKGVLVCNDISRRRIDQLVKQVKRFGHPGVVVTCNDAGAYPHPGIRIDRVLCDVPCSGDGTVRKNAHIFQKWKKEEGVKIHELQKRVLRRGIEILSPGGVLVYSTCSLNPVENELVLASVLGGREDVEVMPFELEGFVMREGIGEKEFRVAVEELEGKEIANRGGNYDKIAYFHGVKNARRVHPQDQNTGGFFVAKIVKKEGGRRGVALNASEGAEKEKSMSEGREAVLIRGEKGIEESYTYLIDEGRRKATEEQWGNSGWTLISKTASCKTVYGVANGALQVVLGAPASLRVVFAGTRLFSLVGTPRERPEEEKWRVVYEGLAYFSSKAEKVVRLTPEEMEEVVLEGAGKKIEKNVRKGVYIAEIRTEGAEEVIARVPIAVKSDEIELLVEKTQRPSLLELLKIHAGGEHKSSEGAKSSRECVGGRSD